MSNGTPAKWLCEQCESTCEGVKEVVPTPCDYCGSTDVVEVSLDTPLAPPKAPWNTQATA